MGTKLAGTDVYGIDLENRARSTHELLYQYGKDNVWQKTKDDFFRDYGFSDRELKELEEYKDGRNSAHRAYKYAKDLSEGGYPKELFDKMKELAEKDGGEGKEYFSKVYSTLFFNGIYPDKKQELPELPKKKDEQYNNRMADKSKVFKDIAEELMKNTVMQSWNYFATHFQNLYNVCRYKDVIKDVIDDTAASVRYVDKMFAIKAVKAFNEIDGFYVRKNVVNENFNAAEEARQKTLEEKRLLGIGKQISDAQFRDVDVKKDDKGKEQTSMDRYKARKIMMARGLLNEPKKSVKQTNLSPEMLRKGIVRS